MTETQQPYLEYLHCLECGYVLGPVVEHEGRTSMQFINTDGAEIVVSRAVIECPICKAKRDFYSALIGDAWQIGREAIDKQGE